MNIPTYSNVPVMLVYFKLFYYDVALYPIFEVCNVLRVQIGYKRVADGSQAFPSNIGSSCDILQVSS